MQIHTLTYAYTYAYLYPHHRVVLRVGIFMRGISSRNYHHCDKTRCANGQSRPVYSSTLSGIHFARMFVYRAINSTNAKCGKLMSAVSTWTRELRLACVISLNYSRNPVSSSSPIQTRLGPGTTPYTLSAIKIKCLYKVNRRRRKTALTRSAENVNWFGRNN